MEVYDCINEFERDFSLMELLGGVDRARLHAALETLLGCAVRLLDRDGRPVLGSAHAAGGQRLALAVELEPVGYLEIAGEVAPAAAQAAAALMAMILRTGARYLMASSLHLHTVKSDYEELQRRHEALTASEARYRDLAQHLEQRVAEQVQTIDQNQRQLYQAEKMASVGQLAAGVAHEINNPIGFIKSNLTTARQYSAKLAEYAAAIKAGAPPAQLQQAWRQLDLDFITEDFAALLDESIHGAERVARIVADLKDFSNIDRSGTEWTDINERIRSVCNVAATQIKGDIELVLDLGEVPRLRCDAGRIGQVLMNLLLNAIQAVADRGRIRIATRPAGDGIAITVEDNGCGIPREALSRIFDPFYTRREVGAGTGLGLTVSRDIVAAHSGRIEVQSAEGQGTTFTIYLPVEVN
ncbi:MAG: ATP-binding protein [Pseudomonadota bacterium]